MDPLSIPASIIGIAAFCGKFVHAAAQFVNDAREVPEVIAEFYENTRNLQTSLLNLGHVLKQRPGPRPFERDHYQNIFQIAQSCQAALERLDSKLPDVPDDPSSFAKARMNMAMSLKSNTIQQTMVHIGSYTQVLQLSLITLSLGTLWGTQKSQERVTAEVRNLKDSIRSANLLALPGPDTAAQSRQPEMEDDVADANMAVKREIQAWRLTVEDVAAAVSLHDPDDLSLDGRSLRPDVLSLDDRSLSHHRGIPSDISTDMALDVETRTFDPEPEVVDCPSLDILQHQLEQNQKMVLLLVKSDIFLKASFYQRKAIRWKEKLAEVHMVPFDYRERVDMNEFLADILLGSETKESRREGREILKALLAEECSREKEARDQDRRCRLYHKLGNVYMAVEGDVKQAIKMLNRAFEGRRQIVPMPVDLVIESGELLVRALQLDQAFDEARGYMEWIRQTLRPKTVPEPVSSPSDLAFGWCKERGFDVNVPGFSFDECDATHGTSPLHLAVIEENTAVLRQMLDQVANFERPDDADGATPLLLAAGTRNTETTALLLDHGARADARDRGGKTPLHRCSQAKGGGVKVAGQLLASRPDLLNSPDGSGRTALFMAAENGNAKLTLALLSRGAGPDLPEHHGRTALYRACERADDAMARALLEHGANPNARGPGLRTPLLAAIDAVALISDKVAVVRALLERGADPAAADADGVNAFGAVGKAGFSTEIRRLLQQASADRRRSSTCSAASGASRGSSNSSLDSKPPRTRRRF